MNCEKCWIISVGQEGKRIVTEREIILASVSGICQGSPSSFAPRFGRLPVSKYVGVEFLFYFVSFFSAIVSKIVAVVTSVLPACGSCQWNNNVNNNCEKKGPFKGPPTEAWQTILITHVYDERERLYFNLQHVHLIYGRNGRTPVPPAHPFNTISNLLRGGMICRIL